MFMTVRSEKDWKNMAFVEGEPGKPILSKENMPARLRLTKLHDVKDWWTKTKTIAAKCSHLASAFWLLLNKNTVEYYVMLSCPDF